MNSVHLKREHSREEHEIDFPGGEEEDSPLVLVHKAVPFEEDSPLSLEQYADGEDKSVNDLEEGEEFYSDPQGGTLTSLVIYFRTINKYSLLSEQEERNLAKLIKEGEEDCKRLVMQWISLFKKELLRGLSAKQKREVRERFQCRNGAYCLFEDLIRLEKKRRQAVRSLKRFTTTSHPHRELADELYRTEAEISKCIAEISLTKVNGRVMWRVRRIPHQKTKAKKRHLLEKEMAKILRDLNHLSEELKVLKNKLMHANLRLVISIAKKYVHHGLSLPDLIQEGNLGLMRAVNTYDYRRGHRFITYATWWIRQAIIRALDCQSRTIRTPVYINEKLNQIVKASNRLLQKYEREPTLEEIARETNTSLAFIEKIVQSFREPVSVDTTSEEKAKNGFSCVLDGGALSAMEEVVSSDLSQNIDALLSELTPREREIVKLRFGIGIGHDHTLEEIGIEFNLSRERIRQILEVALQKLRVPARIGKLKDFVNLN